MSSVDDRIVNMQFNNAQFERAASQTIGTLGKLKQALGFSGATKGFSDVEAAAGKFHLGPISTTIEGVNKKFLTMATIATSALGTITSQAVTAGAQMVKSLTMDPILDGFHEYETNMNAIQTILANTRDQGSNLDDVNKALNTLNHYSDQTIYNFSEMARNIGTFTAAGVDLQTSVDSIKGLANLAAISGSSSEQASQAMYQLSQAIAAGKVGLQDWNSVVNAGMGGAVFQKALVRTAQNMGTIGKSAVSTVGPMKQLTINGESFRESISAKPGEKSWLTSDVLTNTLKQLSGDMTDAQLKAQGFSDSQIKAIQAMGKSGVEAATQVKTLSQLMSTVKESIGSGWAQTFQILFGDFGEAKSTFTDLSNTIGGFVQASAKARNKVLGDWKALGGRSVAIEAIKNVFEALISVIKPIRDAFRDIFPATTGKQLYDLTVNIKNFTDNLKIGGDTADNLKRTFRGFFAVLDIGWQIIKGVLGVLGDLFSAASGGSGGFLAVTGSIGDFLVALDDAIKNGGLLTGFFKGLGAVLALPIKLIGVLAGLLSGLFGGFDSGEADGVSNSLGRVGDRLSPLASVGDRLGKAWDATAKVFQKIHDFVQPALDAVADSLSGLGDAIAAGLSKGNFNGVLDLINTGLLGGILLLVKKFFSKGLNIDFGGGLLGSIKDTFETLTGSLKAMQTQIQAKTLLLIAGAIALLTASVVALSLIDSDKLTKALTAMTVAFGQLLGAMAILVKISGSAGFVKVPIIAASMILLAGAVLILTVAVKNLSSLDWNQLAKGLTGVAVLLGLISVAAGPLSKNSAGMVKAGLGMIALSVAIKILASAVADFGEMSWGEMIKGLLGVAGALAIVTTAMYAMPPNMVATGAGLLIVAAAMKVLASAVGQFANLSWGEMLKGLVGVAGSLAIIAGAMYLFPPNMLASAAALLVVSMALGSIGKAVESMGGMSWSEIAKGLVTLGGALVIIAGGLMLMSGTLAGSAALLVAAVALGVLTPVLTTLGQMSWGEIVKGLVAVAGAFAILGVAGLVLGPLTPAILGLSVALLAAGAGMALFGVGALALATAFTVIAAAGTGAAAAITAIMGAIINLIPKALGAFGAGIVQFAKAIAQGGPAFTNAMVTVLNSLLNAIIKTTPKIGKAFTVLLQTALKVLRQNVPTMVSTGFALLLALLRGISNNIGQIVNVASTIIVKFLNALGRNSGRIIDAGFNMIIDFINGLTRAINKNSGRLSDAGWNLAWAIVKGIVKGFAANTGYLAGKAWDIARGMLNSAMEALGIHSPSREFAKVGNYSGQGLAQGLEGTARMVNKTSEGVALGALDTIKTTMSGLSDAFSNADVDLNPTITPVLDLTKLQKDATKIGTALNATPIKANVSATQASSVANERETAQADAAAQAAENQASLTFIQNNNSPKALAAIDIYRQTKNQVSMAKEVLGA